MFDRETKVVKNFGGIEVSFSTSVELRLMAEELSFILYFSRTEV